MPLERYTWLTLGVATLVVLAFLTGVCVSPASQNELIIRPTSTIAVKAWSQAIGAASVPSSWEKPSHIFRVDAIEMFSPNVRLFGRYIYYMVMDKKGKPILKEEILIFVRTDESEEVVERVLFHEFLHAIYVRLTASQLGFQEANPEGEAWVCQHGGCPPKLGEAVAAP